MHYAEKPSKQCYAIEIRWPASPTTLKTPHVPLIPGSRPRPPATACMQCNKITLMILRAGLFSLTCVPQGQTK